MSLTSTTDKTGPFLISGLPQVVPVGFPFQDGADLIVINNGSTATPTDPTTPLVLNSDYSVTGGGYNSANEMQTGSITVVGTGVNTVPVGSYLVIARNVPINQTGSLISTGPLTVQLLEQAVDKLTTIDQQLNDQGTRSLRFEQSEFLDGTLLKGLRSGNLLGFDSNGVPAFYSPLGGGSVFGAGYGLTLNTNVFSVDTTKIESTVVNIAALKAEIVANFTTGSQVMVSGYYAAGDGGGGLFTYNSASSATQNGGTIIQPNAGTGRWLRASPNNQINVRQFGAKGDNATDDTAAIAAAFTLAVATTGAFLYVPPGTYLTDNIVVTSASGLTIYGDGMGVSIIKGTHATRLLSITTSTRVNIRGLTFDGQCTTRTAGQQAVTMDASKSSFCYNEIINSGEFAFFAGDTSSVTELTVSNNYIHDCYADGIHFEWVSISLIENNMIVRVDDDCIALYYNGGGLCNGITVIGNYCNARNDLGTTTGRGIVAIRTINSLISTNYINGVKQDGIRLHNETGSRVIRCRVVNNTVKLCCIVSGNGIVAYATTDCTLEGNVVDNPITTQSCIDIADWQNLVITGGILRQENNIVCRGIHAEESAGWAASWDNLVIANVTIQMLAANNIQCIYLGPNAAVTMNIVSVSGVVGYMVTAGDYISVVTARVGTLGKIVNNVKLQTANTINPAASAGSIIVAQNQ